MWRFLCVLLVFWQPHLGNAQFDLAQQIFDHVHEQLANSFAGYPSLLNPFDGGNLGRQIAENVHRQLAPLKNMGWKIHNQISKSLMPVRALGIKKGMMNGLGGTTVATYYGKRVRSFIIKDGFRSVCRGYVNGPKCIGYLEPFDITKREDFCYAKNYANVNSRICLSPAQINVDAFNDNMSCQSSDGSPTLILTLRQYKQLCGNVMPWQVVYRYYPNPNDLMAIRIPNSNPYVVCNNNEPGVCEFEGDAGGTGSRYSSASGLNYNLQ